MRAYTCDAHIWLGGRGRQSLLEDFLPDQADQALMEAVTLPALQETRVDARSGVLPGLATRGWMVHPESL